MKNPHNMFKRRLADGAVLTGLWLGLASAYTAELCAASNFDWLLIDCEHAPNDVENTLAQLQAIAPYTASPVVRLPTGDAVLIKRYLDIGAQTLMIPMVETADQAKDLVAAVNYPPKGIRGVGAALGRAARWGRVDQYLADAAEDICLLAQIESVTGMENLEAIARVPGIDGIFIGPSDLAASYGHLGDSQHPDQRRLISQAAKSLHKLGKPAGILATNESFARQCLEDGFRFVAVATDVGILARGVDDMAARFKAPIKSTASAPIIHHATPSRPRRTSLYIDGFKHVNPIPAACVINNILASGLVTGADPQTGTMPPDLAAQAANMYAHMRQIVEAAGGGVEDILKVTVWMNDRNARAAINPGWLAMFPDAQSRPARVTMNRQLGGEKLVEAEFTAFLPDPAP